MLLAAGASAVVLGLASAAYACTTFKGVMNVTASGTVTAVGNNRGMGACYINGAASVPITDSLKGQPMPEIVVSVSPFAGDANCPASQLRDTGAGTNPWSPVLTRYTVTWVPDTSTASDCMNPLSPQTGGVKTPNNLRQATKVHDPSTSEMQITNGSGSGEYRLETTGLQPSQGAVCVSDLGGGQGNQVPLSFI